MPRSDQPTPGSEIQPTDLSELSEKDLRRFQERAWADGFLDGYWRGAVFICGGAAYWDEPAGFMQALGKGLLEAWNNALRQESLHAPSHYAPNAAAMYWQSAQHAFVAGFYRGTLDAKKSTSEMRRHLKREGFFGWRDHPIAELLDVLEKSNRELAYRPRRRRKQTRGRKEHDLAKPT